MTQNWSRADLKARAKITFKKNYWSAVLVSFIFSLILAMGTQSAGRDTATEKVTYTYESMTDGMETVNVATQQFQKAFSIRNISPWAAVAAFFSVSLIAAIVFIALFFEILIGNVLVVGCRKFFVENMRTKSRIGTIFSPFKSGHYWNIVKIMFLRNLFTVLWTLLFIIPGIVKAYEYAMVPFLLAEYPEMSTHEAFTRSKEMMYGNKWKAFVLDLSFLPWHILDLLTLGIVGVFYLDPYMFSTDAELFDVLASGQSS